MPKDFFKVNDVISLHSIPAKGKIHVIGVCGVAMAQLAVELARKGYTVSGSDKEFYEPMGSLLKSSAVKTCQGYDAANVPESVDLVVIGNAISYGNPEVDVVEQRKLPYTCFPKILQESLISGKHSVVVTGTHGKSTTTAIIASMLVKLNLDPSYFVGGIAQDLPHSLHWGEGKHSVVEGDEYDSAFFAKVPKFSFYLPDTCIVNAIEYDHADIYPDLATINKEFTGLVNSLPANGIAFCCIDFQNVKELVAEWKSTAKCKIVTFGLDADSDVRLTGRRVTGFTQHCTCESTIFGSFEFSIPIPGAYNAKNAMVALMTAKHLGLDFEAAKAAISTFKPVKRRQDIRFDDGKTVLVEDFAHHPTAVAETVLGIREAFPTKKIWAVFEPRSNTSRRKVFQKEYVKAFGQADVAILAEVTARSADSSVELIDVAQLCQEIDNSGTECHCLANAQVIEDFLAGKLSGNDAILVMSNGSFGGLPASLEKRLQGQSGK